MNRDTVIGGLIGAGLAFLVAHGHTKRVLCRVCKDPSICQHVGRCEEEDAERRQEYGFMRQ